MSLPVLQSNSGLMRRILAHFPRDLSLAFAYGSGLFGQARQPAPSNNVLDFVFVVDDPITWHTMNIMKNPRHYSFLRFFGPRYISKIQNNYGAGIYYNTLVPCDNRIIKYGVISTGTLIEDLLHWKNLYIAGRLHKPVKILIQDENGKLQAALARNLKSAVTAAFLMLPESFTEEELYVCIAGLSYYGDFRMIIGEDRSKVMNIVSANMENFQRLYNNILQECPQVVYKQHLGKLELDKSPEGQFNLLMALPRTLQQEITRLVDQPGKNRDVEEILLQVAQDPDCGLVIQQKGQFSITASLGWKAKFVPVTAEKQVSTPAIYISCKYCGFQLIGKDQDQYILVQLSNCLNQLEFRGNNLKGVGGIVKSSSITQSAKGILTAGMKKTITYSMKKLRKMWRGWRRKSS